MHSIQFMRNHLVWRPGIAALAIALFFAGLGVADRFPPDPVDELRQALKGPGPHPNLAQRIEALRSLPDMRRALALQEWSTDVAGTEQQYTALADRFKKEAQRLLKNGPPAIRLAVIDMLAEMGPSLRSPQDPNGIAASLAPDLADLVKNGDTPQIRSQAARALGLTFPDPRVAVPPLLDLIASSDLQERRAAANALVSMLRVMNQLSSGSSNVEADRVPLGYIVQLGTAVLPLAGRGLSNPDPTVRRLAADGTEQLAASLENRVPQPRSGEEAVDVQAERTRLASVQHELMPLLEAFNQQKTVLATSLQDRDVQVRLLVQRALESLGNARLKLLRLGVPNEAPPGSPVPGPAATPPPADEPPAKTSNQNQAEPGMSADPLLQTIQASLPFLAADVANPNVQIRLGAVEALESLGPAAAPAAPALIQALGDPDPFVRWAASRTLGRMIPVQPPAAVPGIARLLFDPDLEVRLAACTALDRYGPAAEGAVPDLILAVQASDADVRIAAIRALGGIGTGARPAVTVLATALSDPDERVRQVAASVLGRFGALAASAVPALRTALDDPDTDVRTAASDALLKILQSEK